MHNFLKINSARITKAKDHSVEGAMDHWRTLSYTSLGNEDLNMESCDLIGNIHKNITALEDVVGQLGYLMSELSESIEK